MHIEAKLDDIHSEKLLNLHEKLKQPLADILALAIDLLASQRLEQADSSLVLLAEDLGHGRIVSTDQRDFHAYRWKNRHLFENLISR